MPIKLKYVNENLVLIQINHFDLQGNNSGFGLKSVVGHSLIN